MRGGYFNIDMGGLNLAGSGSQSTTALYPQMEKALAQDKPVYGYGATFGSGKPATPIALHLHRYNATTIYAHTGVLQISVTASAAAVTDLTATE